MKGHISSYKTFKFLISKSNDEDDVERQVDIHNNSVNNADSLIISQQSTLKRLILLISMLFLN